MLELAVEVWILGGQSVAMRTRPMVARRMQPKAPVSWRSHCVLEHRSGSNVRERLRMVDWERRG